MQPTPTCVSGASDQKQCDTISWSARNGPQNADSTSMQQPQDGVTCRTSLEGGSTKG